jgi:hypothetical protein
VPLGGRAGVRAHAEAFGIYILSRMGADHIDKKQISPALLIVNVLEVAPEIKPVKMKYPRRVAGAYSEYGAFRRMIDLFNVDAAVVGVHLQEPFDMRDDKTLGRVIGIGKVNLYMLTIFIAHHVEIGVAAPAPEGCNHLIALIV